MASQTEAPDDLIAELARLMAEDARSDKPVSTQPAPQGMPAPVRIPGGEAAEKAPHPSSPVRIPGAAPVAQAPAEAEPFAFDFGISRPESKPDPEAAISFVGETRSSVSQPERRIEPVVPDVSAQNDSEALDHDGLADLIAAELASELVQDDPLPIVDGPARDDDNFGVPPVFGLGSPAPEPESLIETPTISFEPARPEIPSAPEPYFAAPEPEPVTHSRVEQQEQSDPLSDIERLLGPVVHKLPEQSEPVRSPSPALRSLATPTLPVAEPTMRQEPVARDVEAISVDDAILAAAAATGARVEWVNSDREQPVSDADDFAEEEEERPRRRFTISRAVAGPLVAISLLGIAGFGLYWMLGQGSAPSGPAPLLVADPAVVKDVPEPAETTAPQSVVFNEISGAGNSADEQLVARDQADVAALNEVASTTSGSVTLPGVDGTGVDPNQDGLVNRKVRTVTVRPDGTIISGSESVAGNAILPVERPGVPAVPGADTSTPDLIASTIASETPEPANVETTPVPTVTPVGSGAVVPVVDAAGNAIQGRTVTVPVVRPSDFAQAAAAALASASVPATAPAPAAQPVAQPATPAPAVAPSSGAAGAYVQLASQRSEDAARQSAQSMNTRFGVLFGGAAPEIQRVDLGERGIYYRVLVPAATRDAAANICTNIRAAGGDCLLL